MEPATSSFADWVSATARSLGFRTDAQLAAAIGVQQSTITRWRQGAQPQIKHLVELARLFRMRIDPLLALSGHVPAELLSAAEPPAPPMTESVRRIRDAPIADYQKQHLLTYWDRRLEEERRRLSQLINWVANSETDSRQVLGRNVLLAVTEGADSDLREHLFQVVTDLFAVEAGPRRRRRRSKSADEVSGGEREVPEGGGEDG